MKYDHAHGCAPNACTFPNCECDFPPTLDDKERGMPTITHGVVDEWIQLNGQPCACAGDCEHIGNDPKSHYSYCKKSYQSALDKDTHRDEKLNYPIKDNPMLTNPNTMHVKNCSVCGKNHDVEIVDGDHFQCQGINVWVDDFAKVNDPKEEPKQEGEKVIERLKNGIKICEEFGANMNEIGWGTEQGILISGNDAKYILSQLTPVPPLMCAIPDCRANGGTTPCPGVGCQWGNTTLLEIKEVQVNNTLLWGKRAHLKETNVLTEIRKAIANYMASEGCSCCRGSNHDEHNEILARLLGVPKYSDGNGYNWTMFKG